MQNWFGPIAYKIWYRLPDRLKFRSRRIYRRGLFRKTFAKFVFNPESFRGSSNENIRQLIKGWGNEDWSGMEDFLGGCIEETLVCTDFAIVECGSGLSTLLVGYLANRNGVPHIVLEHNKEWCDIVSSEVVRLQLNTQIYHAPLCREDEWDFYDTTGIELPSRVGLLICDGPPGDTRGGRMGVKSLVKLLGAGSVFLLDDADRSEEKNIAMEIAKSLAVEVEFIGGTKRYARIAI